MPDDGAWTAPGSGRPVNPADVAAPSAGEIADQIVRRLVVPRGPKRSAVITLGVNTGVAGPGLGGSTLALKTAALNVQSIMPICGGSGIISSIDFSAAIVSTAAAAGIGQIVDGNGTLLRSFPISVGAAGTFQYSWATDPDDLAFINGLTGIWTPLIAAFGNSIINVNLDYRSIPIGQRTLDN